ncbi:hypothetical protein GGQ07_003403 [Salinibacter ruber]|uniref:hypothetical protein n=1 Tax=Salinibacter ruber TaxID=146919 RepID=UPI00216839E7|nr:hypothetical protein [Salinibacter ruber]MCS4181939.1 hypothetical protein [Salinibacter ruber]
MALNREELSTMSREELVEEYDKRATRTVKALSVIQEEIHYRDQKVVSDQMWWMTLVVTLLSLSNVALVAYQIFW